MNNLTYVVMLDTALSGWGEAEGKEALFVIACESDQQVGQVVKAAHRRPEMRNIHTRKSVPIPVPDKVITQVAFSDLSGSWLEL